MFSRAQQLRRVQSIRDFYMGWGGKPTLTDVARKAGVSIATVSNALSGKGSLSPATRERILEIVRELGYQPDRVARTMRMGRTEIVGLIVPDLSDPFYMDIAQEIERSARNAGKCLFLMNADNQIDAFRRNVDRLVEHRVEGLIWCPIGNDGSEAEIVRAADIPSVVIDCSSDICDYVVANYSDGGRQIAERLNELNTKRLLMIRRPQGVYRDDERIKGVRSNLSANTEIIAEVQQPFGKELSGLVVDQLKNLDADAIIAPNDVVALKLVAWLKQNGRRVPEDVVVIGFDDIAYAKTSGPTLSTVYQPAQQIGQDAIALLARRTLDPHAALESRILEVKFVSRRSTTREGSCETRQPNKTSSAVVL